MRIIWACAAVLALAGCAATHDGCGSIGLADYDDAFQSKLAQEIAIAGPNAAWPDAVADYRSLRESVRTCQEKESKQGFKLLP